MSWIGIWRNQYGSVVEITDDSNGQIRSTFRTVLDDSSFHGKTVPIYGAAHGDVIGFTAAAEGSVGPAAVSYTGLLRDGKLETLWHTVADSTLTAEHEGAPAKRKRIGAWRAFGTSLDTFERTDPAQEASRPL
jgi:Avidin family